MTIIFLAKLYTNISYTNISNRYFMAAPNKMLSLSGVIEDLY